MLYFSFISRVVCTEGDVSTVVGTGWRQLMIQGRGLNALLVRCTLHLDLDLETVQVFWLGYYSISWFCKIVIFACKWIGVVKLTTYTLTFWCKVSKIAKSAFSGSQISFVNCIFGFFCIENIEDSLAFFQTWFHVGTLHCILITNLKI